MSVLNFVKRLSCFIVLTYDVGNTDHGL